MTLVAEDFLISFERTVGRSLVHRSAVSEVFLTDAKTVNERTVRIGAQLPRCHGYFNDHKYSHTHIDPLLLLEVCRQATLGGAHMLNVPENTILISSDFNLDILNMDAFFDRDQPVNIKIEGIYDWSSMRNGVPRAGICKQSISVDDIVVATHWSGGKLMTFAQLEALREEGRGHIPLWTAEMSDRPEGVALPPEDVFRFNPLNVVLANLESEGAILRASIAPPWQNRALFDHSYDHLTMQILTEAARQIAIIAMSRQSLLQGRSWSIKSVKGKFERFAEIDLPAIVETYPINLSEGNDTKLSVFILQGGNSIALVDFLFSCGAGRNNNDKC